MSVPREPLRIDVEQDLDDAVVANLVRNRVVPQLEGYVRRQRWFGDKERSVRAVGVGDIAVDRVGDGWYLWIIVVVQFDDGAAEYFVPLAITAGLPDASSSIATVATPSGDWSIADALERPDFRALLAEQLAANTAFTTGSGRFHWRRVNEQRGLLDKARSRPSRLSGAEQSNSAVIYEDALFLKLFRKLQLGVNPDEEVGRFLGERTVFRRLPVVAGSLSYVPNSAPEEERTLALAQRFEPSLSDGWSHVLARLSDGQGKETIAEMRRLGERTGELHAALASDATDTAFAPEPITSEDVAGWRGSLLAALKEVEATLQDRGPELDPPVRRLADAFLERSAQFPRRADGFVSLVGTTKTRVHGDYHLGQTLRTPDDDWLILDFEGEPARPIAERRAKTSPLKDVAGMLRSFGYARGAAHRASASAPNDARVGSIALSPWENGARDAFLDGYRAETFAKHVSFLPTDAAAFAAALAAWELDKALYEVLYELNHRPDWLALPLAAILAEDW